MPRPISACARRRPAGQRLDLPLDAGDAGYVRDTDVAVVGLRDEDEYLDELRALGIPTWSVTRLRGLCCKEFRVG